MAKDKQWLLCIDVTIWASALSGDDADWRILLSLINEVRPTDMQLMYREELCKNGGRVPVSHRGNAGQLDGHRHR